ncbi:hypothetical protein D3C85_867170 [compost metagenome]
MGDQPVPVAVVVGGALNMVGLVGQDALGCGQGHWVFVDDGVVGTGFAVFGDIEQGINTAGGPHHVIGGAPQPRQRIQLVVGQHGEGLRVSSGFPVQHIEHPAAELLGQCGA